MYVSKKSEVKLRASQARTSSQPHRQQTGRYLPC